MKLLSIVAILLAASLTTSCAAPRTIPQSWALPAPVVGEACPDISGLYANSGEAMDGKPYVSLQTEWFFGEYDKYAVPPGKWSEIRQVSIQQQGADRVEIVAKSDSGTIEGRRLLKREDGDFSCQDGWFSTTGSTDFGTSGGMVHSRHIRSFTIADGYLMEKWEYRSLGFISIIPIAGSGTRWFRFSRIGDRGVGAPDH